MSCFLNLTFGIKRWIDAATFKSFRNASEMVWAIFTFLSSIYVILPDLSPLYYWFWGAMDRLINSSKKNSIPAISSNLVFGIGGRYRDDDIGLSVIRFFKNPALSIHWYRRYIWFQTSDNLSFYFLVPV